MNGTTSNHYHNQLPHSLESHRGNVSSEAASSYTFQYSPCTGLTTQEYALIDIKFVGFCLNPIHKTTINSWIVQNVNSVEHPPHAYYTPTRCIIERVRASRPYLSDDFVAIFQVAQNPMKFAMLTLSVCLWWISMSWSPWMKHYHLGNGHYITLQRRFQQKPWQEQDSGVCLILFT